METNKNKITIPIVFLSIYIIFTFVPVLYSYLPIFGTIKIVFIAGLGLLISYLFNSRKYKNNNAWKNPIFKSWIVFLFLLLLGIIVSLDRGLTISIFQTIAKYFLVLMIMVKIIDSQPRLDFLIKLFSLSGFVMAVVTVVNYGSGIKYIGSIRGAAIGSGIFADPNDLALFFNSILSFLFYFYFKNNKRFRYLMAIIVVEIAVILTYSRGGFLGSCAVLLGVFYFRKSQRAKILSLILLALVVFVSFAPGQYKDRLSTIFVEAKVDQQTGEYPGRMEAWVDLLPLGMHHPLLGVGAGCSLYMAGKYIKDWHYVHNSFLQVFLEMGFLGIFCYMLFYYIPIKQYSAAKRYGQKTGIDENVDRYQFIIVSLIGFAITAFFLPQAFSPILPILSGIALIQYELTDK